MNLVLSVDIFRAYPKRMRMIDIARAEAKAGRALSNDPRRAGFSVRCAASPPVSSRPLALPLKN